MKRIAILTSVIILFSMLDWVIIPFNQIGSQYPHTYDIDPKLPNVLLISDSTQIRYYPLVNKALEGKANIYRIVELASQHLHSLVYGGPLLRPVNGASTMRGKERLNGWLGDKQWDVIHFNWGLHNLIKLEKGANNRLVGVLAIQDYRDTLQALIEQLENTGAKLIIATTTPVPADIGYEQADVKVLNGVAKSLAEKHDLMINDLYSVILPHLAKVQYRNDIHFNEAGTKMLASKVESTLVIALQP